MKTIMAITNRYGEILCELERDDGGFFYKIPRDMESYMFGVLLCEGDEFKVEEIEIDG